MSDITEHNTPGNGSESVNFKLKFDNPHEKEQGIDSHQIDAEVLAQSLLDVTKLVRNSVKTINGEEATAKLDVAANKEGSFIVDVIATLSTGGIEVLRTIGLVANTSAITTGSLMSLLKILNNRTVVKQVVKDNGDVKLELDDDTSIDCTSEVAELIDSYAVRKSVEGLALKSSAAGEQGVLQILDSQEQMVESISSSEAEVFKAPPRKVFAEEKQTVERTTVEFTIVNFTKKTGWQINKDDELMNVKITDSDFFERVSTSKREFKKGQVFTIDLLTRKKTVDGNTSTTYEVQQVI